MTPRVVVAGTSSGVGKTSVATGLAAALSRRCSVATAKVGPDFIDPGYHAVATGRPSRNLDLWLGWVPPPDDADVLVVEGVMGLFDGASTPRDDLPEPDAASTAHVARRLEAPVLLVVDASAMSGSVAALVHGFATYDPRVHVAGVVLNKVGSDGHETLLREALEPVGVPVLGALRRDDAFAWRDRHLGLVPVVEQPAAVRASVARLADAVERSCDLDAILRIARAAPAVDHGPRAVARHVASVRVAVAAGPAFSFQYPDNLEQLAAAGAELVPFDPLHDAAVPAGVDGLIAGGGFPEVYAEALAANRPLLDDVHRRVRAGLVTWAECGGLLWLARSLEGRPLAGVVDADAEMTDRLTLGYRTATFRRPSPVAPAGTVVHGHEFHYSRITPEGDAVELASRWGSACAGWASPTLLATYLHLHLGARPDLAEHFVGACGAAGAGGRSRAVD